MISEQDIPVARWKKFKKMEWELYWTITQEKAPKPG